MFAIKKINKKSNLKKYIGNSNFEKKENIPNIKSQRHSTRHIFFNDARVELIRASGAENNVLPNNLEG